MTIKHDTLCAWVAFALVLGCSQSDGSLHGSAGGNSGPTYTGINGSQGGTSGSVGGGGVVGGTVGAVVPGLTVDNPGGTWTVTPDTSGAKPPKGAGGSTGTGATGGTAATCAPGVTGVIVTNCGYPYASSNPLTSVEFNESEVLRAIRPSFSASGGVVSLLYGDEHAMTLGVRQVVVSGTTTDYPVSPLTKNPDSIMSPLTGTNALTGDQSGLDPSLRPLWPVLYITDTTNDPSNRAGDWQMGGRPINPNVVYGTWKSAVRTVDKSTSPPTVSITPDVDPAKNDWNLILNDPVPTGIKNEGWSAEVRWGVIFQPGHTYRLQVIVHDGDQNKVGGDCGEACIVFCTGGSTTTPPPNSGCPLEIQACGEGLGPTGGFLGCPTGTSCVNGCCTGLTCPTGSSACGQIGAAGEIVACPSGQSCVSGCCLSEAPIP
jgi:hypothetical protein